MTMSNSKPAPCLHPRPTPRPRASPSPSKVPSPPGRTITLLRILPDESNHNSGAAQTQTSTQFPGTRKYTFPLNPDPSGQLKGCPSYAVLSYTRPRPSPEPKPTQTTPIHANSTNIPAAVTQALHHIRASRATCPRQPWFVWVDCLCPQSESESDLEAVATRRAILQGAEVVYVCLGDETESKSADGEGAVDVTGVLRDEYWGRMDSVVEVMLARRVVVLQGGGRGKWRVLDAAAVEELSGTWGGRTVEARRRVRSRGWGMSFAELWEAFEAWDAGVGARESVLAFLVVSGEEVDASCCLEKAGILGVEDAQMEFDDDDGESDVDIDEDVDEEMTMADSYLALATRDHRFGTVLEHIMRELDSLEEECNRPVGSHGTCGRAMGNVDAEVARFQGLLRRMDHLERELDRVLEMWDIVRRCRGTVDEEMDGC